MFVPRLPFVTNNAWPGAAGFPAAEPRAEQLAPKKRAVSDEMLLLTAGVLPSAISRLQDAAAHLGIPLREAARLDGEMAPSDYLRAMSALSGFEIAPPWAELALQRFSPVPPPHRLLSSRQPIPLRYPAGAAVLNADNFSPEALASLGETLGAASGRVLLANRQMVHNAIIETYETDLAANAAGTLLQRCPRLSAATGMYRWQALFLIAVAGLFMGAMLFAFREATALLCGALTLMFMLTITLRVGAAGHALFRRTAAKRRRIPRLRDAELPTYTVVAALYKEERIVGDLIAALARLDYPAAKLDIKLVFEAEDEATIAAAFAHNPPPHFEILIVPDGAPRTKPRALNYALQFARGDFLVIYDAEDRPQPDQLRKAAGHFRDAPAKVVCLQARLIFDNLHENWLSKQFTIEYASLFGGILPMLDAARLPIPLGGTSNHFRTAILRRVGGWDAHNVTEDADLGMRLYRLGYRAEILVSTTYEEAACDIGNWIRQRTRWLKGWLQTYFVHMRQPFRLLRELRLGGFLAFQGHFAGVIIAALVHPLSYVLIAHDAAAGGLLYTGQSFIGRNLWMLAVFNFIAGYASALALGVFVLRGKRVRRLIPQLVFIPVYWLLISVAAYRALHQFTTAPFYWEKTEHGVTRIRRPFRR